MGSMFLCQEQESVMELIIIGVAIVALTSLIYYLIKGVHVRPMDTITQNRLNYYRDQARARLIK